MKIFKQSRYSIISQYFGENKNPIYKEMGMFGHNGIDFPMDIGEPIYWDCDLEGIVWKTTNDIKTGVGVVVLTQQALENFLHIFWHLKQDSILVQVGQRVKAGDILGLADNTGYSTGSHLHRGLKPVILIIGDYKALNPNNGYFGAIDPMPYYQNIFVLDQFRYSHLFSKDIVYGEESMEVRELQIALKQLGFFPIGQSDTGGYYEITRRAVKAFQTGYQVASWWELAIVNGKRVGKKTRNALNDLISKGI